MSHENDPRAAPSAAPEATSAPEPPGPAPAGAAAPTPQPTPAPQSPLEPQHHETAAAPPASPFPPAAAGAPAPYTATPEQAASLPGMKSPILAAVLSGFPGMGHIYAGLYLRGATFFLIVLTLLRLVSDYELLGFALAFFWLFNIIDAYRQTLLINHGLARDLGMTDLPDQPRPGQGGLVAGAILVFLGTFELLDRYFEVDLRWLFDLWPVGLIVIGLWLIVGTLRDRRRARRGDELAV